MRKISIITVPYKYRTNGRVLLGLQQEGGLMPKRKLGQPLYLKGFNMRDINTVVSPSSTHEVLFPDDATVLDFIAYINTRRAVDTGEVLWEDHWRDRCARFWTGMVNLDKIFNHNRCLWSCFEGGTRTVWLLENMSSTGARAARKAAEAAAARAPAA